MIPRKLARLCLAWKRLQQRRPASAPLLWRSFSPDAGPAEHHALIGHLHWPLWKYPALRAARGQHMWKQAIQFHHGPSWSGTSYRPGRLVQRAELSRPFPVVAAFGTERFAQAGPLPQQTSWASCFVGAGLSGGMVPFGARKLKLAQIIRATKYPLIHRNAQITSRTHQCPRASRRRGAVKSKLPPNMNLHAMKTVH